MSMTADAREALRHLTTAFENHLEAIATRRSPEDAAVDDAYDALAEAFERYEEALDLEFAETLPLVLDDADSDDIDEDDLDDDDQLDDDSDDDLDDEDLDDDDLESFSLREE